MKKRILSLLLALCLLMGLMPAVASAEGTGYSVLTGSIGNAGEGPNNLVDGSINTKWCVSFSGSAYIIFKTPAAMKVAGYAITTGNDNASNTGRNPKNWSLYGSSDYNETNASGTWSEIHKVENDTVLRGKNYTTYYFDLETQTITEYQYFKLEITATKGADVMQMSEFVLTSCAHEWVSNTDVAPTCTEDG